MADESTHVPVALPCPGRPGVRSFPSQRAQHTADSMAGALSAGSAQGLRAMLCISLQSHLSPQFRRGHSLVPVLTLSRCACCHQLGTELSLEGCWKISGESARGRAQSRLWNSSQEGPTHVFGYAMVTILHVENVKYMYFFNCFHAHPLKFRPLVQFYT